MIRQGLVSVNGEVVTEMGYLVDPTRDHVRVDGKLVHPRSTNLTVMINKPKNTVCSKSDPEKRKTVYELLPQRYRSLSSIGRLDYHTEGLLLLTSDGALAQRLSHPSFACSKTYHVKFRGDLSREKIDALRQGVMIDGRLTKPADVREVRSDSKHQWLEITIREGRNRQIRRMGEAIGHPVLKLKRVAVGGLVLGDLAPGEIRGLTEEDLALLESQPPRRGPRAAKRPRESGDETRMPPRRDAGREKRGVAARRTSAKSDAPSPRDGKRPTSPREGSPPDEKKPARASKRPSSRRKKSARRWTW